MPVDLIKKLGLSPEDEDKVRYRNTKKLLKLSPDCRSMNSPIP